MSQFLITPQDSGNCAGVGENPIAPNVVGSPYAVVPSLPKTANAVFTIITVLPAVYSALYGSQSPFGPFVPINAVAGPPSPPDTNNGVSMCFYSSSPFPAYAYYVLTMKNPATNELVGNCTYVEPYSCGTLTSFAITPSGANQCAGLNGNPIAPNIVGTPYAVIPNAPKTANMVFSLTTALPAVYSAIYGSQSPSGPFVRLDAQAGPPSAPDASNSVSMCLYSNTTLPAYAYYVLTMVNPATGEIIGNCTYVEPYSCGTMTDVAITPSGANQCAGVGGNPIPPNVVGTPYAVIPNAPKTANMQFQITTPLPAVYSAIYGSQSPYGPFKQINAQAGPPSVPDASGLVSLCLYSNTTFPSYLYYILTMVNPATGELVGNCTYVQPFNCGNLTSFTLTPFFADQCAGVNGNPISQNVVGTPYAVVPNGPKAANAIFTITNPLPPVYMAMYGSQSPSGPFVRVDTQAGPPSPPVNGSLNVCFYTNTTIGIYLFYQFVLVNPATGQVVGSNCTYKSPSVSYDYLSTACLHHRVATSPCSGGML